MPSKTVLDNAVVEEEVEQQEERSLFLLFFA